MNYIEKWKRLNNERIIYRKPIFTSKQIILKRRKEVIVLPLNEIDKIFYARHCRKNWNIILFLGWYYPEVTRVLYIHLKEKINGKKLYRIFITYKKLQKIPKNIFDNIDFVYKSWDDYDSYLRD